MKYPDGGKNKIYYEMKSIYFAIVNIAKADLMDSLGVMQI